MSFIVNLPYHVINVVLDLISDCDKSGAYQIHRAISPVTYFCRKCEELSRPAVHYMSFCGTVATGELIKKRLSSGTAA